MKASLSRSAGPPESFPETTESGVPLGQKRDEIAKMIAGGTLLQRATTLTEVGSVAALMASDYASPMTATVANMACGAIVDQMTSMAARNRPMQRTALTRAAVHWERQAAGGTP